jgi:[acyl-carrier-protein] S-malonyltransferase
MGQALAQKYPEAASIYAQADQILGYKLSQLCFEGPEDLLTRTDNAQPALLTTSLAHLKVLQTYYPEVIGSQAPLFAAGHSLGEFSALVAVGALDFADALRLVRKRGQLMDAAGKGDAETNGGGSGMVAVIGGDDALLENLARETGTEIANYNSPGQTAISGTREALARFTAEAPKYGIKKVIPLAVSAAFHSSLMKPMADELGRAVAATTFHPATIAVISNVNAQPLPLADSAAYKEELTLQTYNPVRWVETVQTMYQGGVRRFVEIGTSKVLAGLIKRIAKDVQIVNSEDILK